MDGMSSNEIVQIASSMVALIGSATALIKIFRTDARTEEIQADRKRSKDDLEVWKKEMEMTVHNHSESLKEGNARFEKSEAKMEQMNQQLNAKMDEANSKIDRLIGFVSAALGQNGIVK